MSHQRIPRPVLAVSALWPGLALGTGLLLAAGTLLPRTALALPPVPPAPEVAAAEEAPTEQAATEEAPAAAAIQRQIVLELGRRQISLKENGTVVGSWPVAIGDPSTPTPVGSFTVQNKVVNPQYQSTRSGKINATVGPQAPLGDRWIGFKQSGLNQYGIHGTPTAWAWTVTSRAAVSNGCVRMLTPHVRELFEKVEIGTPVIVKR
ncbi:L,D-transpeptidase [Cyanobium sp. LEGE 06113]|uniref:L,D-transpeptidase n=1 Tax=Cyanobium sp. LEGE 06113 TaxID=1297573 RepID=UPI001D13FCA2|nr:L,D-transpeptidase [Cyanobium sp. LEGE 06113]